ncbi:hypothetical protein ACIGO9_31610 [Nocardia asteroides]|uniref:hypothetical protein n=1 Tax=Nocardia asteroides TaxID=1824 RepID=UPI0037CA66D6
MALLDEAALTNKQVLAHSKLPISETTFSRHLLGQAANGPSDDVVTAVVTAASLTSGESVDAILVRFPVLRGRVSVNTAGFPCSTSETVTNSPPLSPEAKANRHVLLLNMLICGDEYRAAAMLDRIFNSHTEIAEGVGVVAERNPEAAAGLLAAVGDICGAARAGELWDALNQHDETIAQRISSAQHSGIPHYPQMPHRLALDEPVPTLLGARIAALIHRGDFEQAAQELDKTFSENSAYDDFLRLFLIGVSLTPGILGEVFDILLERYPNIALRIATTSRIHSDVTQVLMHGLSRDFGKHLLASTDDSSRYSPSSTGSYLHCAHPKRAAQVLLSPEVLALKRLDHIVESAPKEVISAMARCDPVGTAKFIHRALAAHNRFDYEKMWSGRKTPRSKMLQIVASRLPYDRKLPDKSDELGTCTHVMRHLVEEDRGTAFELLVALPRAGRGRIVEIISLLSEIHGSEWVAEWIGMSEEFYTRLLTQVDVDSGGTVDALLSAAFQLFSSNIPGLIDRINNFDIDRKEDSIADYWLKAGLKAGLVETPKTAGQNAAAVMKAQYRLYKRGKLE